MELNVLLVGNGGREHALAWKLAQSPRVKKIYVAPGNGGTGELPKTENIAVKADDYEGLVKFAKEHGVGLVVPGPEAPLVDGIEDYFQSARIPCFGPSKAAARMEGSKTFAKDFMARNNIPTAAYKSFKGYDAARSYLESIDHSVVIKASGLAGGKGVILPQTKEEAQAALRATMLDKEFGAAGEEVVIEEFLEGDELSILTFSDGVHIKSLPPAQDHKQIFDGDKGPNTGGMGCYAPTKIASDKVIWQIHQQILQPTIDAMREEGYPFVGLLFTGLMMTTDGPKVLEYNVRFGDPETQTLLPLLSKDTDLATVMIGCTHLALDKKPFKVEPGFSATVVASAGGYPGSYGKGFDMTLSQVQEGTTLFHAGTTLTGTQLKTAGGRVIAANATDPESLERAVGKAYEGINAVHFDGMYYRRDIAHRAFKESQRGTKEALSYSKDGGVDIDAGNKLVEIIKPIVKATRRPGADADIGGFGGTFDLSAAGYSAPPIIVAAIDGIGTKLKIAYAMDKHDTIGIDLVAMNVNDLIVQGADPLMFLDCFSCSKLDPTTAALFIKGVAEGCIQAGSTLVGGETAEMPGMYSGSEYDGVGVAVGAVQKAQILPKLDSMSPGDVLLGVASSGVHSNGFSLVRRIVEREGLQYNDPAPWDTSTSVGLSLLTPTRIYVKSFLPLLQKDLIKGMAHITGGGLTENIPRMLPKHLSAAVDVSKYPMLPIFQWLKKAGNLDSQEFARTFNTGLGMVVVVGKEKSTEVQRLLAESGEAVYEVGCLVDRKDLESCKLDGLYAWA